MDGLAFVGLHDAEAWAARAAASRPVAAAPAPAAPRTGGTVRFEGVSKTYQSAGGEVRALEDISSPSRRARSSASSAARGRGSRACCAR